MSIALLRREQNRPFHSDYRELHLSRRREAGVPSKEECEAIWARYGMSEEVIIHSRMVSELARILAIYLNQAGFVLNLELIVACGYLHELAEKGATIIDEVGCPCVSDVVASSIDIRPKEGSVDEADLVSLADMLVEHDRLISPEERFDRSVCSSLGGGSPRRLKPAARKLREAERIKERIEADLGIPLEQIVQKHRRGIHAASLEGKREIYLVSHGAVVFQENRANILPKWSLPLSDEGIKQARALEEELRYAQISAIYCSDFRCARETAEIIGKPHGLHPKEREDLREAALGKLEGLKLGRVTDHHSQGMDLGEDILHYQVPGGESLMDCTLRVIPALYSILHSTRGNILIVGHPWLNSILLCQAMGKPLQDLFEIHQVYGCLNVIQYGDFAFEVKVLNETGFPHLVESASPIHRAPSSFLPACTPLSTSASTKTP